MNPSRTHRVFAMTTLVAVGAIALAGCTPAESTETTNAVDALSLAYGSDVVCDATYSNLFTNEPRSRALGIVGSGEVVAVIELLEAQGWIADPRQSTSNVHGFTLNGVRVRVAAADAADYSTIDLSSSDSCLVPTEGLTEVKFQQ